MYKEKLLNLYVCHVVGKRIQEFIFQIQTLFEIKTALFFTWIGSFKEYYCESGMPTLNEGSLELEIYNDSAINSNFVCLILQDIFPTFLYSRIDFKAI